ncbi:lipopolysaccharide biosynthesis protein [Marinobacter lipolyticus]|uniref:lipopolysaccharide biosynthesis protein n=1 Tax=Marinobacter lipolyticus TaxID=209639 RepID=UPI001BD0A6B7|nr:lipopolysaccharide biosynthesis protein [Marinobacter lipolyticus]
MENIPERRRQTGYETSLVDVATIFLKHRRVFFGFFVLVTIAGLVYALMTPDRYQYVSLVKLAQKSSGEYIEKPATIIAELENLWVPNLRATHHAEHDRNLPFKISASNPENTGLVRIVSEASSSTQELIASSHQQIIERITTDQKQALAKLRKSLEKGIESLGGTIAMLEGGQETGEAIAASIEKQLSLEAELDSLVPAETLVVGRRSGESTGPARRLIVVLSAVLGILGGVFLAFFTEFIGLVREKVSET